MSLLQVGMIALFLCLLVLIGIYLYHYLRRSLAFWGVKTDKKSVKGILIVLAVGLTSLVLYIWGVGAILILYLMLSAICMELLNLLIRKVWRKETKWDKVYRCGLVPLLAAAVILGYGYFNMRDIRDTAYTVYTDKDVAPYRVAFISDLHYGTTLDGEELREQCRRIGEREPDVVVLGGDIVDEDTSLEQMQEAFAILGTTESKYGVFYIFGNHDKSRYRSDPNYTLEQLTKAIESTGIHILADETYEINDDLVLVGRDDAAYSLTGDDRLSGAELISAVDPDRFLLLLDHQPLALQENAELGFDLQLSGHTHGGQIWPLGLLNGIFRFNEQNYGYEKYGNLQVIVSSGMAGWGYPVRTEGVSEYVIIDIKEEGEA